MASFFNNIKVGKQFSFALIFMAILCVIVGAIGLTSMLHYNRLASLMGQATARAVAGEKVNSTVLSVVMDSRGIYMSLSAEEVEKYAIPLLKNLDKIQKQMKEWRDLLPEERKGELDAADQKVKEFVEYRSELVRRARELSIAEGRAWGDNDNNRANRKKLNELIVGLAEKNAKEVEGSLQSMQDYFVHQRALLMGLLGILIPVAILVTLFISSKFIVAPIRNMTKTMGQLAGGQLDVAIPGLGNKNEIGDMARTVEVFRSGLIDAKKLTETEKAQQREKEQRMIAVDKLIRDFDLNIKDALSAINSSSTELEATARSLSEMAARSSTTATSVAAASEEATTNVMAVAHATERMADSIQGIVREIGDSRVAIDQAAAEAQETSDVAAGLIEATRKIDDVVSIIQDIAGQTNLLALNATIEAARAGEMGKGFAVVANEVKNLATQTASSTEQIAEQVGAVQTVSTQMVAAINKICETIRNINTMSATVTETMAAQSEVTAEISANITEAAQGTRDVTQNINDVSRSATETGNAAEQLLVVVSDIASQSVSLKNQVGTFLTAIKGL